MPSLTRQPKPSSAGRRRSGEGGPTQSTIPNSRRVAGLDRYPRRNNNSSPTQATPPAKSPVPLANEDRVRVAQPKAPSPTAAVWPGSTRPPTPQQQSHPQPNTRRPTQATPPTKSPLPLAKEDRVRVAPTRSTIPNSRRVAGLDPATHAATTIPPPPATEYPPQLTQRRRPNHPQHPHPQPTPPSVSSVSSVSLWCILLLNSPSTPTLG